MDYVKLAKRRERSLENRGVENNAMKAYLAMIDVAKQKATGEARNRGIKAVSRQFVKNNLSTATGIKRRYKKEMGEKAPDLQTAAAQTDSMVKLNDETLRENLGSEVLKQVFENQEIVGYSTRKARNALSRYFYEHTYIENGKVKVEEFNVDDAVDAIVNDLKERL